VLAVARRHDDVWATAGVHPHDAKDALSRSDGRAGTGLDEIAALLGDPKVVAVGECGLDYHYDHSPRDVQRRVFAAQVALANEHDLALVIHTREAWDDTFDVLAAEGVPARTVFHCFTGGAVEARRALDVGGVLSFSGIITFKTADDIREAAALCPIDRLLVETDSPYLAPVPHRGRTNQPGFVPLVGAGVALAKGVTTEAIEAATHSTAEQVFSLA
jgi:TatD DNase family protein